MVRRQPKRNVRAEPKKKRPPKAKINPRSSDSAVQPSKNGDSVRIENTDPPIDSVQPVPEQSHPIQTPAEPDNPPTPSAQPSKSGDRDQRYTHQQCQKKMCVFCYNTCRIEKTQTLQHPSIQKKLSQLDIIIPQNITVPNGLCEKCRRDLFQSDTAETMKELLNKSSKSFGFIREVSETGTCDCKICSKVRSDSKNPSLRKKAKRGRKPKEKPIPKPCCNICQKAWEDGHECESPNNFSGISERLLKNVNPVVAEVAAVRVFKESEKSPHGTSRLAQGKGGPKLPLIINSAKKRKRDRTPEPVSLKEIQQLQGDTNSTMSGGRKMIRFANKISKVEKGAQKKLSNATRIFDDDFAVEEIEFQFHRTFKGQAYPNYQKRCLVYVKDISKFVLNLIEKRNLQLDKCLLLVGNDGGGNDKSFKVTLNIINLLEDESVQRKSSGSDRSQILAEVAGIPENHHNIKKIFEIIKINDIKHFSTNDLKVDMIILGKQSCSCKFNCCFCESFNLALCSSLITIGSAVEHHQRYLNFCFMMGLDPSSQKARVNLKSRNYKNHEFLPLLSNNFSADWNKKIIDFMVPPSLHSMLGFVKKNFDLIAKINPKIAEQWGNFAHAYQQVQHGGEFNGNACARLLENVGYLEFLAFNNHAFEILPFVEFLRDFNEVRKKCFSVKLHKDWRMTISKFKASTLQMHKDFQKFSFKTAPDDDGVVKELGYNFFVKLHVSAFHVEYWCENIGQKYFLANDSEDDCPLQCDLCVTKREDNESVGIGLGLISEQPSEAVHKKFGDLCSRSFPFWNQESAMYPQKRKRAVCTFNANNSGFVSDS